MKTIITHLSHFPKRLLLSSSILLCLLSFAVLPATALAATPSTPAASTNQPKLKCLAKDTNCIIQFGDTQISNRITALNKLDAAVTDDHNKHSIDDAHADSLHSDIQTNITGLNTLKSTLDAETTVKAARQDVEKVYTQFRIYAVVLPRDYKRLHLAIEITVDAALKAVETSTGNLVNNATTNKTELTNLFSNFKDQLSDAEHNIDLAQQTWPLLTPDSYNNDRATYTTNLKNLTTYEQTAHTDLHKAAADLHKITQDLK